MDRSGEFSLIGMMTRLESWLAIVYLWISFPLGTFYFILFITWFSLGIGLAILIVGVPLLGLMLAAARALAGAERQLANWFLDVRIPAPVSADYSWVHPLQSFKSLLTDPATWKGFAFLLLKFPLGIVSFVTSFVLILCSIALMLAPLAYPYEDHVYFGRHVNTPAAAAVCFLVGVGLGLAALLISTGLAVIWRTLAQALLGPARTRLRQEAFRTGPVIIP